MYAELMNENVRIRAENVMLRKVVFALIAQADKDPFMSIGHFAEHGPASSALAEIRALNDEQERQMAQFIKEAEDAARYRWLRDPCSGAERVIFYCRGDYGRGLMSSAMLDAAIDEAMEKEVSND